MRELLSPLMLAAYAAWGAVWIGTVSAMEGAPAASQWAARAALLAFLLLFVADTMAAPSRSRRRGAVLALALASSAFVVIATAPGSSAPILLVLLAGVLAAHLAGRPLWLALLAINLGFAGILVWQWQVTPRFALVLIAAYGSFQLFAALVMRQAQRAEAMAADLREANAALQATRVLLEQGARDSERLRLSRELHDVAGHALTALKLNLGALARDPNQPDPQRVALCAGLADELLQNLRGVVRQMRAESLDLHSAIGRLAAPFPRPRVHLEIGAGAEVDSSAAAEAVLRTVQEGLTNAARHSGAANLWVVLQREGDRLRLELRDDGRGATALQPGSGLAGMRELLQALGGGLELSVAEGAGLRLHAWLPVTLPA